MSLNNVILSDINRPVKMQKRNKGILKQIKMEAKQANLWDTACLNKTEMVSTYR